MSARPRGAEARSLLHGLCYRCRSQLQPPLTGVPQLGWFKPDGGSSLFWRLGAGDWGASVVRFLGRAGGCLLGVSSRGRERDTKETDCLLFFFLRHQAHSQGLHALTYSPPQVTVPKFHHIWDFSLWTRVTDIQSMAATNHGCPSCVLSHFSRVQLLVTLWTAPHQAPLSLGLPREECWSGLLRSPPRGLPDPGIEAVSSVSCVGRWVLYH